MGWHFYSIGKVAQWLVKVEDEGEIATNADVTDIDILARTATL